VRTILFLFSAVSYYREVAPVVARFATSDWKVHVVFGSEGDVTERALEECRSWGCEANLVPSDVGYGMSGSRAEQDSASDESGHGGLGNRLELRLRAYLKRDGWLRRLIHPLGRLRHLPGNHLRMRRIRRYASRLIASLSPDVVVQGAYHSCGQIDNGIEMACRSAHIPTFCIPSSPYLGARTLKVGRLNHLISGMSGPQIRADYDYLNALLARLFPGWTTVLADGVRAFYWDPIIMFAAWMNGMAMHRTWMKPSLSFDRVFVYSDYSKNLLVEDGYPVDGIVSAGQPLLDDIWKRLDDSEYAAELYSSMGLPLHSPFILLNVEPAAEHDYCSWERHWQNFEDVMLATTYFDPPVILSLHPLCDYRDYAFAEDKYGVRISRKYKIHELYPYCTVSVSFPCSTNLLAAEFGKPLLVYDYFGLTMRDPDSAALNRLENSEVGENGEAVKAILTRMLGEPIRTSLPIPRESYASETIYAEAMRFSESTMEFAPPERGETVGLSD